MHSGFLLLLVDHLYLEYSAAPLGRASSLLSYYAAALKSLMFQINLIFYTHPVRMPGIKFIIVSYFLMVCIGSQWGNGMKIQQQFTHLCLMRIKFHAYRSVFTIIGLTGTVPSQVHYHQKYLIYSSRVTPL